MTAGSSSRDPFEGESENAGFRAGGVSFLVHGLIIAGLMLLPKSDLSTPQKRPTISEKKIEEVTEHIKDRHAEILMAKLDRIREIQTELGIIRARKLQKFEQFATVAGRLAPADAVKYQRQAINETGPLVHQIEGVRGEVIEIQQAIATIKPPAGAGEREPLWDHLGTLISSVSKNLGVLKLKQVAASEAQNMALQRLRFADGEHGARIGLLERAVADQKKADEAFDAAADRKSILDRIAAVKAAEKVVGRAQKRVEVVEDKVAAGRAKFESAQRAVEAQKKGLAQIDKLPADPGDQRQLAPALERAEKILERESANVAEQAALATSVAESRDESIAALELQIAALNQAAEELGLRYEKALEFQKQSLEAQKAALSALESDSASAGNPDEKQTQMKGSKAE